MKNLILFSLLLLISANVYSQTEAIKPPVIPKDIYNNPIPPSNVYYNPDNGKYYWEKGQVLFTPDTLTYNDSLSYYWFNNEFIIAKFGLTDTGVTTAAAWYQIYPYYPGKIRIRRTNVANLTAKSIIQARGFK
jgi:hypothetical protein